MDKHKQIQIVDIDFRLLLKSYDGIMMEDEVTDLMQSYDRLLATAQEQLLACEEECDTQMDLSAAEDRRYGFSLILRPPPTLFASLDTFYRALQAIEPDQYYYPMTDLHVTLLSVISCTVGFNLSSINTQPYLDIFSSCLREIPSFSIRFRGLTMSSSCIMLRGYPDSDSLKLARDRIRSAIIASGLQHSMDQRYIPKLAHSTIIRFRKKLQNRSELLRIVEAFQDFDFGQMFVNQAHAIGNDWYLKKERLEVVQVLPLKA